ncbi:MAG: ATP-binding protein [Ruminococcaceae bacterium]|nr:ATP-binding protein [Oscillospiraceae bacterium]
MVEISLHILDIVQNSVRAKASLIEISVIEDTSSNLLTVRISDNGCGMSEEFLNDVTNPFRTSRTTRKVGLGVPMFKNAAEQTGGSFEISSKLGEGTVVEAKFVYDSIDRQPLGDMAFTMVTIVNSDPDIDYVYTHTFNGLSFDFDTRQIRETLGSEVPLTEPQVLSWIEDYINSETENIYGGIQ